MKVILCVVLFAVCAVVKAQQDYPVPDYWQNDYDNYYDNYNDGGDSTEKTEVKQTDANLPADVEDVPVDTIPEETAPEETAIEETVPEKTERQTDPAPENQQLDVMEDYQIEDNRSDSNEKEDKTEALPAADVPIPDEINKELEQHEVLPLEEVKDIELPEETNEDYKELGLDDGMWGDFVNDNVDDVDPLPVPETEDNQDVSENSTDKDVSEEPKEKDQEYLDEIDQAPVNDDDKDMADIIEETRKLLAESDDALDTNNSDTSDEQGKSDEDVFSENNDEIEEDTPAKVYADLNADLDKLFETLDKLSDDDTDEDKETDDEVVDTDNVQDYEEKYGKPYKEDVALSWRSAEADAADPKESENTTEDTKDEVVEDTLVSAEKKDDDDYEIIEDSNLSKIFEENAEVEKQNKSAEGDKNVEQEPVEEKSDKATEDSVKETDAEPNEKIDETKQAIDYIANYDDYADTEPNPDDDIDSVIKQIFDEGIEEPQGYGNDALVDENEPKEKEAAEFESVDNSSKFEQNIEQKSVDELTSAEYNNVMKQFVAAHSEDLDVNSEDFAKHVTPKHIILSVDEPTVITSPEYPNNYPRNTIVDWIFDGPGTGIEMNITDFTVRGGVGDYLLVKPGGIDETGTEGLVFSHRLNSVRKYRFSDVNRMFVRFQSHGGMMGARGFSFSVKLMFPLPEGDDEEIPEPEPVVEPPKETLTINLAGITLPRFREIKQEFVDLIADMAKEYIRDNKIEQGLNTTYEVTQITRTAVCNIQWPEYENCVEVTFGVPLQYKEEDGLEPRLTAKDLDDMWTTYIINDTFSERLRSLGVTEYAIPNDRTVLMVWLVISAGVIISMAMLAFALWRFSCFEDYTRMQPYGDTDSLQNEKRNLDLYPTPHQTLPPLYSENDYKWADDKYDDSTRVDMGGFSNKSYIRDELYDLDSDEDVITPRDRKGVVSPRDFYDA